jgi:tRNA-specific 2-thiouridylase
MNTKNNQNPLLPGSRIIVGMSGGVDSSVAALLLQQQGYQIEGLFMKNWEGDDTDNYCPARQDMIDAQQVCDKLGIPLHIRNFSKQYWDGVFAHFLAEYEAGRTPNPDILCNKEIKFKTFLDEALALGAAGIATGHYARISHQDGHFQLLTGLDKNKDQSYFLYTLKQHQLSHALFPVGELEKPAVRALAEAHGFITHNKKDSTGICFIGERKFTDFLQTYLATQQAGDMVTPEGKFVGKHQGLAYYTLGQRKGLGIGGGHSDTEDAWFAADKDMNKNHLIVVQGHNHPAMLKSTLNAINCDWCDQPPQLGAKLTAKIRYRQQSQACQVSAIGDNSLSLVFDQPQRAVTPGQSVVLYDGDICLGGAIINEAFA